MQSGMFGEVSLYHHRILTDSGTCNICRDRREWLELQLLFYLAYNIATKDRQLKKNLFSAKIGKLPGLRLKYLFNLIERFLFHYEHSLMLGFIYFVE